MPKRLKTLRELSDATLRREAGRLRIVARMGGMVEPEHLALVRKYELEANRRGIRAPRLKRAAYESVEGPAKKVVCFPIRSLTPALRSALPDAAFALPGRRYPIPTGSIASVSLARAQTDFARGRIGARDLRAVESAARGVMRRCSR